jgi:hypothetical protein
MGSSEGMAASSIVLKTNPMGVQKWFTRWAIMTAAREKVLKKESIFSVK